MRELQRWRRSAALVGEQGAKTGLWGMVKENSARVGLRVVAEAYIIAADL